MSNGAETPSSPETYSSEALAALVRADRVHDRVYTDPAVFELEMTRLWGRAWIFVGHDSQLPAPGDFITTRMGREPVIVVRGRDGAIHVLINRCSHRGTRVCNDAAGRATRFRCPYHGWTYAADGRLVGVPLGKSYPAGFDLEDPALGLARAARVDAYRGFIFATLSADGPDLMAWLGPAASIIDDLCDRSPDGRVEVTGGVHKHVIHGNWKLQLENLNDLAHPAFVHESSIAAAAPAEDAEGLTPDDIMKANGASNDFLERAGVWAYPHGHSHIGGLPVERTVSDKAMADYRAAMEAAYGSERTDAILAVNRHQGILYPSVTIQAFFQQIKVLHPVAVDRTEIHVYPVRLVGAPDAFLEVAIRFLDTVNAPSSMILTDDLEVYARTQASFGSAGRDWILFANGADADRPDDRGGWQAPGTSELPMRNQYAAWRELMLDPPPAEVAAEAAE